MTLVPEWLCEPPEVWPEEAREFYRLCHAILKRAQTEPAPLRAIPQENQEPDPAAGDS